MTDEQRRALIAQNLILYRKAAKLTQIELAEKLNYSDKAVSKWERAESTPDVCVLCALAELYGITVNDLLSDSKHLKKPSKTKRWNRALIATISAVAVWFVATVVFTVLSLLENTGDFRLWLIFIYAVPVSAVVFIVFSALWFPRRVLFTFISLLVWSIAVSVHLSLLAGFWLIYIIAAVLQILCILWYLFEAHPHFYSKLVQQNQEKRKAKRTAKERRAEEKQEAANAKLSAADNATDVKSE